MMRYIEDASLYMGYWNVHTTEKTRKIESGRACAVGVREASRGKEVSAEAGALLTSSICSGGPQGPQRFSFSFSVYRRLSSITSRRYSLLSWIIVCLILPSIFSLPEILAKVDLVMIPSTRGTLPALDV